MTFLCRYYGVSRSGYYAWTHRIPSQRFRADATLRRRIRRIHERSHGIYGSPRVWEALNQQGIPCSENCVVRLMRHASLQGRMV